MAENTKIEWTDATWNPIRGCSRVSEGCRNCYAEKIAARFSRRGGAFQFYADRNQPESKWTGKVGFIEERLADPLRWKKPKRIFVNSMSDLFHDKVADEWIDRIFAVMALCPQHTFQILTKRPERMLAYMGRHDVGLRWLIACQSFRNASDKWAYQDNDAVEWTCSGLGNVWLGVSVEDQKSADERIPLLLQTPAGVRFVSYEPALGPVDFHFNCLEKGDPFTPALDWIIAGGESGPGARPAHPGWFRSTRDQCRAAGIPFFMKQWGEWGPNMTPPVRDSYRWPSYHGEPAGGVWSYRVGKKSAGRLLDGREWSEYPQ